MQQIIQQITQQFVDRLPENEQYYRLTELRSWDFPSFIVRRIKVELERNLAESMIIPKTDWANTDSDAVLMAWQKFVDAIRAEARLPASYAQAVIETAVADVMEMLVQPRKNIPSVLFGTDDELNSDEVHERLKAVVVYPHFNTLISKYLQKKELHKLSKERCQKIVADTDEKLTSSYSPLNWAQILEPLFKLAGGKIDTNLLRLFFEDKNMPRIARKFDLMDDTLSRAGLIEALSSPDLLDFEGYESDQSSLFDDQPAASTEEQISEDDKAGNKHEESTAEETAGAEKESGTQPEDGEQSENPLRAEMPDKERIAAILFPDETKSGGESKEDINFTFSKPDVFDFERKGPTLNAAFMRPDHKESQEENNDTLNAVFRINSPAEDSVDEESKKGKDLQSADRQEEKKPAEGKQSKSVEKDQSTNGQESASKEKTPIWMRYMSDEEAEEYENEQQQEKTDKDGFIEEPIIDLTKQNASEKEIKTLNKLLKSDRELFVEEIFRGSERAFDEAVEDIAIRDSWGEVSKYIEKNIFKRNMVDMYSEVAVDFTDRLQTYFLNKQN